MTTGLAADVVVRRGDLDLAVRFSVARGETVALLGPNGAGKSTLLAALAGLVPLDDGRVTFDGEVVDDVAAGVAVDAHRRDVGMVFQEDRLLPHLTVLDNVAFGLRCRRGLKRSAARREARAWIERAGIADLADVSPSQLSGGQAQRVAIARALVTRPRLLLLDEPLVALDAAARTDARRDLRDHLAGDDIVCILVTHDPIEAAALADRLVVIEKGNVVQSGSAGDLSAHPRSTYVADLAGVNLFHGDSHGGVITLAGAAAGAADGAMPSLIAATEVDGDVLASIHPRAVTLHREAPEGSPRNVWRGVITAIDGEAGRARVQVGGSIPIVAEITTAALADLRLMEHEPVWVSVKATEISVFPA